MSDLGDLAGHVCRVGDLAHNYAQQLQRPLAELQDLLRQAQVAAEGSWEAEEVIASIRRAIDRLEQALPALRQAGDRAHQWAGIHGGGQAGNGREGNRGARDDILAEPSIDQSLTGSIQSGGLISGVTHVTHHGPLPVGFTGRPSGSAPDKPNRGMPAPSRWRSDPPSRSDGQRMEPLTSGMPRDLRAGTVQRDRGPPPR